MNIYLAGGFYADDWQKKVMDGFRSFKNAVFFNPKDKENGNPNDLIGEIFKNPRTYTAWDLKAIDRSDCVFAYIDKGNPAVGVIAEIGYAVGKGKEVILVLDEPSEDSFHQDRYFDFIRNMPNVVSFYGLEQGIAYLGASMSINNVEYVKQTLLNGNK